MVSSRQVVQQCLFNPLFKVEELIKTLTDIGTEVVIFDHAKHAEVLEVAKHAKMRHLIPIGQDY